MLSFFYLSTFSLELAGFSRPDPESGHKFKLLAAELSLQNLITIFCTNKNSWVKKETQKKVHCFCSGTPTKLRKLRLSKISNLIINKGKSRRWCKICLVFSLVDRCSHKFCYISRKHWECTSYVFIACLLVSAKSEKNGRSHSWHRDLCIQVTTGLCIGAILYMSRESLTF